MGWHKPADEFADTLKIASIFSRHPARPLRRAFLRQGAGPAPARARRLRRRACESRPAVCADYRADEGDANSRQGRNAAGDHAAQLGADPGTPARSTSPDAAISLPCGMEDGRPIGLMLVSCHYAEETIYRAAAAFERSGD
jgi:amidase